MPIHHLRIPSGNDLLDTILHEPENPRAWVVTLHGLEANKDGRKYLELAELLTPLGIGLARFDFRGCGLSTGSFGDTNVASRIEDGLRVIEALKGRPGAERLGLYGSSMGGYVALFLGFHPDVRARLRAIVTLAAPSNLDDLVQATPDAVAAMPAFVEEYKTGRFKRVPPGNVHTLLLHGDADAVVPIQHNEELWAGLGEPRKRRIFPDGDHRFSQEEDLSLAMAETVAWFKQFLLAP
jgi:alpha-beta hydrolase superfamily lysophospholipase